MKVTPPLINDTTERFARGIFSNRADYEKPIPVRMSAIAMGVVYVLSVLVVWWQL
jgi:hypothetical protein